jgi:membrane protease YdiL (CAAX protease family)
MSESSAPGWRRVLFNPDERRLRAGWRLLAVIPLQALALLLAGLVLVGITDVGPTGGPGALIAVTLGWLVFYLAIVAVVLAMARWLDRRPWDAWLADGLWVPDLAVGLLMGLAMATAAALAGLATGGYALEGFLVAPPETPLVGLPDATAGTGGAHPVLVVALVLAIHVGVGLSEELLIRGYLLTNLAESVNGVGRVGANGAIAFAAVATSLLFGALHLGNPNVGLLATVNIVLAGLFFAATYVATGSLWIPNGIHVGWNLGLAGVFGLPVSGLDGGGSLIALADAGDDLLTGGGFGPEAGLVFYPALAVGLLGSLTWLGLSRGSLAVREAIAIYSPPEPVAGQPAEPDE